MVIGVTLLAACGGEGAQSPSCTEAADCDNRPEGACLAAPSGAMYCAFGGAFGSGCASGLRWGSDVAEGLANQCVSDGSIDAGPPDARPDAEPPPAQLTVMVEGAGSGTVTSTPGAIDCEPDCQATFDRGTTVTLTPTPAEYSIFTGWSGACAGTDPCVLTMDGDKDVTATFGDELVWFKQFPRAFVQRAVADAAGDIIMAGYTHVSGTADLGGGYTVGANHVFVAKLSGETGDTMWAVTWGGGLDDGNSSMALDANGNIYVVGGYGPSATTVGTATLPGMGGLSGYVVKLDPDGSVLWAQGFGYSTPLSVSSVLLVEAAGDGVLAGLYTHNDVDIGGTVYNATGWDVFVVRLDGTTGEPDWVAQYGGAGDDTLWGLAAAGTSVALAGGYEGTANFGAGCCAASVDGSEDLFLGRYDLADGAPIWATHAGGTGRDVGNAVSIGADDSVYAASTYNAIEAGLGPVLPATIEVRKLDSSGADLWTHTHVGTSTAFVFGSALAPPTEAFVIAGFFEGGMNLGGGLVISGAAGSSAAYLAAYDALDGSWLWSRAFPSAIDALATTVTVDANGAVIGGGWFNTSINVEGTLMTSGTTYNGFVLKITPQ
jgi:hypothetical protein